MSDNPNQDNQIQQKIQLVDEPKLTQNMTDSIQPTHANKQDLGIIQSHTNYSMEANASQNGKQSSSNNQQYKQVVQTKVTITTTAIIGQPLQSQGLEKVETIKTQSVSIQVGDGKPGQVVKCYDQTYAPESVRTHEAPTKTELSTQITQEAQQIDLQNGKNTRKQQVEIQVGVSLLDEPEKVINKAKQQRILFDYPRFTKFVQTQKVQSDKHKTVFLNVFDQIEKKKMEQYAWFDTLKDYFNQYATYTKDFYEKSQKPIKQEKVQQLNKYLNLTEQLKQGFQLLYQFKRQTGDNYKKIHQYIATKMKKDLQQIYNKYINEMNAAQGVANQKKKECVKIQQQFKKQAWKINKMFTRAKEGKKQEDDFFVQMSSMVVLYKKFRQALVEWGRQIIQLRKSLIDLTQSCNLDLQFLLNNFKTQSNNLYGIQKIKYDRIIKSRDEVVAYNRFSKLIVLTDADYIRSIIVGTNIKQSIQISDQQFQKFVELAHFDDLIENPDGMLPNLIVKVFNLKDQKQELVNTVSGNLVLYDKTSSQALEKISIKNIKTATPVEEGSIEIQEKVSGVIFNSKKKTKLEFKNGDRAEQLLCFLGQGETNN